MNLNYIKINGYKEQLKKDLKPERYQHTMRTVLKAMELSVGTDADRDKVFIAALLHDCAKYIEPTAAQKSELADFIDFPSIIHAPLGAIIAREKYGVTDETVLNAIKYHTTGRSGMTVEEKIVLLADSIEDGRSYPSLEKIKKQAEISIEHGILCNLESIYNAFGENTHHLSLEAIEDLRRKQ